MNARVVVSQLGARMDYAVPRILNAHGMLEHFYTDICATVGWPSVVGHVPPRFLPAGIRRLAGRKPSGIPSQRMTCFNGLGLSYALRRMRASGPSDEMRAALDAGRRLSELVVSHGFGQASGFYGFVRECLEQLQAARSHGLWTAVEQNIAARETVDRLAREEQERFPAWETHAAPTPFAEALAFGDREKAEWAEADMIVCPSDFVRQTVAESGGPVERCIVVPYGVDTRFQIPVRNRQRGPLRVLTIGAVGLRKGSPYILEAARQMRGQAVFRMVGSGAIPPAARAGLEGIVELTGPIPRLEIIAQYAWADVFLLPSLCEGSATVTYEALAAGLPVVTTPNSGSVVRDGADGFVVPIRDADAIVRALQLLDQDRARLFEMSHNARFRAQDFDLPAYGRRLCDALDQARAIPAARTL